MLRYVDYDIVFQEIPDEVTLAINLSNCPNRCKGCHSPHLLENVGESLTEESLGHLLQKYGKAVTCDGGPVSGDTCSCGIGSFVGGIK